MTIVLESNPIRGKLNVRTGWEQYRKPADRDLDGRRLELTVPDGGEVSLVFSGDAVEWSVSGEYSSSGQGEFGLTELRPGYLFIDIPDLAAERSLTVVIDEGTGSAMVVHHILESRWGALNLVQAVQPARIAGSNAPLFAQTNELMGRRALVAYEDDHVIEHVYLNPGLIGYQLVAGENGAGKGNALRCTTWKIAHELFLITFVEPITRPEGVALLMDFEQGLNTGKLFVRDDYGLVNMPAGARIVDYGPTIEYPESFVNDPGLARSDQSIWHP